MYYSSLQVCWCSMNRTFLYIIINYCWWIYYKIKEQKWKDFYHFSSLLVTFLILIQQYHTGVDDDNQEPWLDDSDSGTTLNKITYYPMEKVEFSDFLNIIRKAGSKLRLLNFQEGHLSISKKNWTKSIWLHWQAKWHVTIDKQWWHVKLLHKSAQHVMLGSRLQSANCNNWCCVNEK